MVWLRLDSQAVAEVIMVERTWVLQPIWKNTVEQVVTPTSGDGSTLTMNIRMLFTDFCSSSSVHNIRCERCWYDLNQGFGVKWKNFFHDLEVFHGLVPTLSSHIWLLHHLFLPGIQSDAELWRNVWNTHIMQLKGERHQSPREMFFFGTIVNGPRGLHAARDPGDEEISDPTTYGIDWNEYEDDNIMANFFMANSGDHENAATSNSTDVPSNQHIQTANRPERLSVVEVIPPNCPLNGIEVGYMDHLLAQRVDLRSRNMNTRRMVWDTALALCIDIIQGR